MSRLYCLLFGLIFFLPSYSQISDSNVFRIDTIPPEGILLNKGWKFQSGDDPQWANPEFADDQWHPIDPSLDIRHIPELQNSSLYWFRLKFQIDSPLRNEPLAILLSQVGASEIYLDGKLLYKFGVISKSQISTKYLLSDPLPVKMDSHLIHVLAVRYSYSPKSFLVQLDPNGCLNIILNTVAATFSNSRKVERLSLIIKLVEMSLFLLVSLMSLYLYFSYRAQKAYKYFGIYWLLLFTWAFLGQELASHFANTDLVSVVQLISLAMLALANVIGLNGTYLLYRQKKSKFYYMVILWGLCFVVSFFFSYDWSLNFYIIYPLPCALEFLRATVVAKKSKQAGTNVLIVTISLFCLLQLCLIFSFAVNALTLTYFFGFLSLITTAIGWSIFISGEFGRTAAALQGRVKEVEELSIKTIAQEQEKQQILASQNEKLEIQVQERTAQLTKSLADLKSTQAQLIQSEKMASLGELTTGIAHEIQNPLNFINNFSDVNKELLLELTEEIAKGHYNDVKEIAKDVIDNEEKINNHGKRADAIVKAMVQHSRTTRGEKEATDISRLADEYLRLAYHGFREKHKSFEAKLETDFDDSIEKINVVPQEIGRVLFNLIINAFYAVNEKTKQNIRDYRAAIILSTKKLPDKCEISITDNGPGIRNSIKEKIFQPFFTTKPTGQGTGLGLSLAYDIVKAHGGEIRVESKEGEGANFTIELPLK